DLMEAVRLPQDVKEQHRLREPAAPARADRVTLAGASGSHKTPGASGAQTLACAAGSGAKSGPKRDGVPVHLMDIHIEKGMHCVDCHFTQDVHGNGKLYGEVRAAIEIQCTDCHGTVTKHAPLRTSGPAAPDGGRNLEIMRTPWGQRRFERRADR